MRRRAASPLFVICLLLFASTVLVPYSLLKNVFETPTSPLFAGPGYNYILSHEWHLNYILSHLIPQKTSRFLGFFHSLNKHDLRPFIIRTDRDSAAETNTRYGRQIGKSPFGKHAKPEKEKEITDRANGCGCQIWLFHSSSYICYTLSHLSHLIFCFRSLL